MKRRFATLFLLGALIAGIGVSTCSPLPESVNPESFSGEKGDLLGRVGSLYTLLTQRDVASRYIRPDLDPFFETPSDASLFIVDLLWQMRQKRLQSRRILGWRIAEVEFFSDGEEAEVVMALRGRYYLFTWRTLWRKDRWVRGGGRWFLKPWSQVGRSVVEP